MCSGQQIEGLPHSSRMSLEDDLIIIMFPDRTLTIPLYMLYFKDSQRTKLVLFQPGFWDPTQVIPLIQFACWIFNHFQNSMHS